MKKGQEIGHLHTANSLLEQACKLKLNNSKEKELKGKTSTMQGLIAKAKKENDVRDEEDVLLEVTVMLADHLPHARREGDA